MNTDLNGKNFVVTGAGSGIGRATALALAKSGATVFASDLNLELAKKTVSEIIGFGGSASAHQMDVTKKSDCIALAVSGAKGTGSIGWVGK